MEKQLKLPSEFRKTKGIFVDEKKRDVKPTVSDIALDTRTTVDEELKILKSFDLDSKYGPCIGITRLCRWERAKKLELNPPNDVYKILLRMDDPEYTECLWRNEKGLVP